MGPAKRMGPKNRWVSPEDALSWDKSELMKGTNYLGLLFVDFYHSLSSFGPVNILQRIPEQSY
jgi:hypothetical protein